MMMTIALLLPQKCLFWTIYFAWNSTECIFVPTTLVPRCAVHIGAIASKINEFSDLPFCRISPPPCQFMNDWWIFLPTIWLVDLHALWQVFHKLSEIQFTKSDKYRSKKREICNELLPIYDGGFSLQLSDWSSFMLCGKFLIN